MHDRKNNRNPLIWFVVTLTNVEGFLIQSLDYLDNDPLAGIQLDNDELIQILSLSLNSVQLGILLEKMILLTPTHQILSIYREQAWAQILDLAQYSVITFLTG